MPYMNIRNIVKHKYKINNKKVFYSLVLHGEYSKNPVNDPLETQQLPTGSRRFRLVEKYTYLGAHACI